MHDKQISSPHGAHWRAVANDHMIPRDSKDGRTCIHLSAEALNIIWGNDRRFWQWIKLPEQESMFGTGAELLQVNWIEVTRKLDLSSDMFAASTKYKIYYVVKFKVDAFGWHSVPIVFKVAANGEESSMSENLENYRRRHGEWHEIFGGEFTVPHNKVGSVEFGMFEAASDWWKGGMVLEGVKLKPVI